MKNLETQVGQLALAMQNQPRDSFPSDTKKNPKDCMALTLRSVKELKGSNEAKKKQTGVEIEKTYQHSIIKEKNININGLFDETEQMK